MFMAPRLVACRIPAASNDGVASCEGAAHGVQLAHSGRRPRFRGCGESRQSIAKTWRVRLHVGGSAGGDRGVEHYGTCRRQFAITAIRTSYAQQQRSTAVSLGDDGMERMRAQIANVDANQYLDELIKGMGETSVTAAQKNLSDVGAIASQLADLSYTSSPDPDKSKYIQPVRATAGKDAKHTEYTVNTVVERCFRASGEISCKTASQLGISRSSATSYTANTSTSATADILDPGKTVSGAFTFGAHTYMPMIRVVVGVTWDDNMHQGKTCLYTTSELLDIGVDNKLII